MAIDEGFSHDIAAGQAARRKAYELEVLARMAARLAGRDPDEHQRMELASQVVFDGPMWRYPDFLARAETAFEVLYGGNLLSPSDIRNGLSAAAPAAKAG